MPFTPSHAAAVLPFLRTPLPPSALVLGSMAPDLPYYLPLRHGWPTHAAVGVVTVDILLGLVAWCVWHGVLTAPAMYAAPAALRGRLTRTVELGMGRRLASVRQGGLLLIALAVGAATHVLWDEFSHADRWGTEHIGLLTQPWGGLAGYRWVQYASGALGAAALAGWGLLWWRRTTPEPVPSRPAMAWVWVAIGFAGVVTGVTAALAADGLRAATFAGATKGGGAALGLAVVLALGWQIHRLRTARRDSPTL